MHWTWAMYQIFTISHRKDLGEIPFKRSNNHMQPRCILEFAFISWRAWWAHWTEWKTFVPQACHRATCGTSQNFLNGQLMYSRNNASWSGAGNQLTPSTPSASLETFYQWTPCTLTSEHSLHTQKYIRLCPLTLNPWHEGFLSQLHQICSPMAERS